MKKLAIVGMIALSVILAQGITLDGTYSAAEWSGASAWNMYNASTGYEEADKHVYVTDDGTYLYVAYVFDASPTWSWNQRNLVIQSATHTAVLYHNDPTYGTKYQFDGATVTPSGINNVHGALVSEYSILLSLLATGNVGDIVKLNGFNGGVNTVNYPWQVGNVKWGQAEYTFAGHNVPDGGMTLALLGFAVAGLAAFRRRK